MAEAAQGNNQQVQEIMLRAWLRDNNPEMNYLINDFEFSHDEIKLAQMLCQDYWNETPPYIGVFSASNSRYRYHLMMGTTAQLLFIAAHRFRRNALPMSAGGVSIDDQNKFAQYEQAANKLWDQFRQWVKEVKISQNMSMCWGVA